MQIVAPIFLYFDGIKKGTETANKKVLKPLKSDKTAKQG